MKTLSKRKRYKNKHQIREKDRDRLNGGMTKYPEMYIFITEYNFLCETSSSFT